MTASSAALAATDSAAPAFDDGKAQVFAARLMSALNESALMLMTSVGHRTGLFDAFSRVSPAPSRSSPPRPTSPSAMSASGWR